MPSIARRVDVGRDLAWVAAVALGSFGVSYALVDRGAWPRNLFVLGHVLASGALLAAYVVDRRPAWPRMAGDWRRGLGVGALAGAFMIAFVLSGPSSPAPRGFELAAAIGWVGMVYGTIDALLLNVFPALVAQELHGATAPGAVDRRVAVTALAISVLLTITYHLGFPEFRGPGMVGALIGNTVMTASGLIARSALAPVLAHVMLHVSAVCWGYLSALPAPPHYPG